MPSTLVGLPTLVKKYVWDVKYAVLGYPKWGAPEDVVRYMSNNLSPNSSVLDLGCGRGSLLPALRNAGWMGSYLGVDISGRAIREARNITDQRSAWAVSDFDSFRSPLKWDAIAMVESIYYVELSDVPAFLGRAAEMLNDGGMLVFRVHDLDKHDAYIEAIYRFRPKTEKLAPNLFRITAS